MFLDKTQLKLEADMETVDILYEGILMVIFRDGVIQYHNISSSMSTSNLSKMRIENNNSTKCEITEILLKSEDNLLKKFASSSEPQHLTTKHKYPDLSTEVTKTKIAFNNKKMGMSRNVLIPSNHVSYKKYERSVQSSWTTRNPLKIFYPDSEFYTSDTIVNIRSNSTAFSKDLRIFILFFNLQLFLKVLHSL